MNLKEAGNIIDFTANTDVKSADSSEVRVKKPDFSSDLSVDKKPENIEKTAEEVQDYLKNLAEDKGTLEEVLNFINSDLNTNNTKVEFSFNDKISQMMVQVKDKLSGEVIRSLPPEHLVKLMEKFREDGSLEGVILSKQV
ncbi:MAG: flagellar protein FlaG [Thermodesulfobacteriota bacterium]